MPISSQRLAMLVPFFPIAAETSRIFAGVIARRQKLIKIKTGLSRAAFVISVAAWTETKAQEGLQR
jgi:hypothetical protein